jgi:hypothetical protein
MERSFVTNLGGLKREILRCTQNDKCSFVSNPVPGWMLKLRKRRDSSPPVTAQNDIKTAFWEKRLN